MKLMLLLRTDQQMLDNRMENLTPRMLGCAAEIEDHLNRGPNMDTSMLHRYAGT